MADRILSIIIPTRNQGRTLAKLIETLQRLRLPRGWQAEIIAGYTESTDNTLEILEAHGIRTVHCMTSGPGPARNEAARVARGELLYFVDSDVCPLGDDFLIRLLRVARSLGRFGAFGGPILLPESDRWNPVAIADHFACWFNWTALRPSGRSKLFQPTVSLVVPRDVFVKIGGFKEDVRVLEDHEIQLRLRRRRYPIYFIQSMAVSHAPRGTLARSCRHSWYWGGPFREIFLKTTPGFPLRFPVGSKAFALNLPWLYARRIRLVLKSAWRTSRWQTCYCLPFLAITVLAWALGVVFGEGRPGQHVVTPV